MVSPDPSHPARPPLRPLAFVRWLWQLAKDVLAEFRADDVSDVAAAITFWTLLSIPAAALALVSALSSVEAVIGTNSAENLERQVQRFVADTFGDSQTISDAVDELFTDSSGGVVTIAALIAFFTLSRGFAGLIRGLDRAYEVEDRRSWWHLRLTAIGLGVGTIIVATGSAVVLAILPDLPADTAFRTLAAPAMVALVVAWAATIFHVGPYHRTPWRYDLPGALLTALGWIAATQLFALYVRAADQFNQVQGTVGAVLLGFTLLYVLSIVLLLGAELNDVIGRRAGVVQQPVPLIERYEELRDDLRERVEQLRDADESERPNR